MEVNRRWLLRSRSVGCIDLNSPYCLPRRVMTKEATAADEEVFIQNFRFCKKPKTFKKRLVSKAGDIMVEVRNIQSERWRFWVDLFTTLMHLKWRWVLLLFCCGYVFTWLIFGCLWALLVTAYGPGYCVEKVRLESLEQTCGIQKK